MYDLCSHIKAMHLRLLKSKNTMELESLSLQEVVVYTFSPYGAVK